jgi:urease accessory protein
MKLSSRAPFLALVLAGCCAAAPALAHHPMGGATPATLTQGLLSGLGHPIIGIDHLAALLAVGLIAARFSRGLWMPLAWVAAMVAGAGLHLDRIDLPHGEVLVALSVMALGLVAALRPTLPTSVVASLFAAGGFVHGFALAESIVGAEATPLIAYFAGLIVCQSLLSLGALFAARWLAGARPEAAAGLRYAGLAVALVGTAAFASTIPGLA